MSRRAAEAPPAGFRAGAATSAGHRRRMNEDAFLAGPTWFVVADGMGGHAAGDVASALAIERFAADEHAAPRTVDDVTAAIGDVNTAIRRRARHDATTGMGTTIVGAVVIGAADGRSAVAVFHVGDARCYRLHAGRLDLLTRDHTHVQELVDAGRLEPDGVHDHPLRNVVTRALGPDAAVEPDVALVDGSPGRLLLCSDGLTAELDARRIGRVLAGLDDPQDCADRLVGLALAGDARDDVTALVVDLAIAETVDAATSGRPPAGGAPDGERA